MLFQGLNSICLSSWHPRIILLHFPAGFLCHRTGLSSRFLLGPGSRLGLVQLSVLGSARFPVFVWFFVGSAWFGVGSGSLQMLLLGVLQWTCERQWARRVGHKDDTGGEATVLALGLATNFFVTVAATRSLDKKIRRKSYMYVCMCVCVSVEASGFWDFGLLGYGSASRFSGFRESWRASVPNCQSCSAVMWCGAIVCSSPIIIALWVVCSRTELNPSRILARGILQQGFSRPVPPAVDRQTVSQSVPPHTHTLTLTQAHTHTHTYWTPRYPLARSLLLFRFPHIATFFSKQKTRKVLKCQKALNEIIQIGSPSTKFQKFVSHQNRNGASEAGKYFKITSSI